MSSDNPTENGIIGGRGDATNGVPSDDFALLRLEVALSIISHKELKIPPHRNLEPFELSLLELLTKTTDGGKTVIDANGLALTPGHFVGGTLTFTCCSSVPLTYYLEPLVYLAPLAAEDVCITLKASDDTMEYLDNFPSLECFCNVATVLLRYIGCPNVQFRYKEPFEVIFECSRLNRIAPFDLSAVGKVKKIRGTAQVRNLQPNIGKSLVIGAKRVLDSVCDNVWIALASPPGKHDPMTSISLVAEGTNSSIYTRNSTLKLEKQSAGDSTLSAMKAMGNSSLATILSIAKRNHKDGNAATTKSADAESTDETLREKAERIGAETAQRLLDEILLAGTFDSSHQHMPLVFMALAGDYATSKIRLGSLNFYTRQSMRLIKRYFGVKFSFEKLQGGGPALEDDSQEGTILARCVGINYINAGKESF